MKWIITISPNVKKYQNVTEVQFQFLSFLNYKAPEGLQLCMIYVHVSHMKGLIINNGTSVALQRNAIFQQQK